MHWLGSEGPLSVGLFHQFSNKTQRREQENLEMSKERQDIEQALSFILFACLRTHSYLMFIIRSTVRAQKDAVAIFPTPLEPTPCDSPPLHPSELSTRAPMNKNSPARAQPGRRRGGSMLSGKGEVGVFRPSLQISDLLTPHLESSQLVYECRRGERSQLEGEI